MTRTSLERAPLGRIRKRPAFGKVTPHTDLLCSAIDTSAIDTYTTMEHNIQHLPSPPQTEHDGVRITGSVGN